MIQVLAARLDQLVEETSFSGVISIGRADHTLYARAAGLADRGRDIPNTLDTRFAIASGTKTFTALAMMSLVSDGALPLDASVHSLLEDARELIHPEATVRQLLAHTSGMGDYLDEDSIADIEDYVPPIPTRQLARPADFLPLLRGRPQKFAPGTRFAYCNSGYVLLALLIEAVGRQSYHDVVQQRVCVPAGMPSTAFLRLDELPTSTAIGYLPKRGWITNQHHVPVRGGGDGGAYTKAADLVRFWTAFRAGHIVPAALAGEMQRPQHDSASTTRRYGLGFWLEPDRGIVFIEGSDAGISFRSRLALSTGVTYSVLSNTTSGAWPIVKELEAGL